MHVVGMHANFVQVNFCATHMFHKPMEPKDVGFESFNSVSTGPMGPKTDNSGKNDSVKKP